MKNNKTIIIHTRFFTILLSIALLAILFIGAKHGLFNSLL